ncbi:DUF4259 domain-containing protein [Microcoleus sp. herbarium14]|uniref:DUF4259 domain-containing protein n=1 Tax=Microcoleus sp. herbarium14 TaxID=3055439 RepID=UPI002FD17C63
MGAWGVGPFDNDTAWNWIGNFEDDMEYQLIVDAFEIFLDVESDYDPGDIEESLIAAEIVAAKLGKPSADFPEDLDVNQIPWSVDQQLQFNARRVVARLQIDSTLEDFEYTSGDELVDWQSMLSDLYKRLS